MASLIGFLCWLPFIGYTATSRQYKLCGPSWGRIIVSTAPTFAENQCLDWDSEGQPTGDFVTPFHPMVAAETPETEAPSNAEITNVESPDIEDPNTIVVDTQTRPTESPKPGDLNLEDPESHTPELGRMNLRVLSSVI